MISIPKTEAMSGFGLRLSLLALMLLGAGCVNGPIRYKTLGFRKYATLEMFKRSPLALKPLGAVGGVVVDGGVLALETVTAPLYNLYFATEFLTSGDHSIQEWVMGNFKDNPYLAPFMLPLVPVVCTAWYAVFLAGTPYLDEEPYQGFFGAETGVFANKDWVQSSGPPKNMDYSEPVRVEINPPSNREPQ